MWMPDQQKWMQWYGQVADVYDLHAYSDTPWNDTALWQRAHNLTTGYSNPSIPGKPWFVGEAGCGDSTSDSTRFCTYNNSLTDPFTCSASVGCSGTSVWSRRAVDSWWETNLPNDGARVVMAEETNDDWATSDSGMLTANPSGVESGVLAQSVFAQGFDGQGTGSIPTGYGASGTGAVGPASGAGPNQFTSATVSGSSASSASMTIVAKPADEANQTYSPYKLGITLGDATGAAFLTKQENLGTQTIDFRLQFPSGFTIPGGGYITLVKTGLGGPDSSQDTVGTTSLIMTSDGTLQLKYYDRDPNTGQAIPMIAYSAPYMFTDRGDFCEFRLVRDDYSGTSTEVSVYVACPQDGSVAQTTTRVTFTTHDLFANWQYAALGAEAYAGATAPGAFYLDDVVITPIAQRNAPTLADLRPRRIRHTPPHLGHTRGWLRPLQIVPPIAPARLVSNPVKLSISKEGVYRLTGSYLASQNVDLTNIDLATLGLSDNGVPVPLYVSSTGTTFGSSDYLEFYAHPVNNTYNASNVYVLSDQVTGPLRAAQTPVAPPLQPASSTITLYSDLKRAQYLQRAPGAPYTTSTAWPSDGDGHWTEGYATVTPTSSSPVTLSFPLAHALTTTGGSCFLTAPVDGQASQGSDGSYTMQVSVTLNGNALPADPSFSWTDPSAYPTAHTLQATFPCSGLIDSSATGSQNTLSVGVTLQPGSAYDAVSVQSYHVGYMQSLCAQAPLSGNGPTVSATVATAEYLLSEINHPDELSQQIKDIITNPTGSGSDGYTVQGFSQAPISLWRVTNGVPSKLIGWQATPSAETGGPCNTSPSTYDLPFADAGSTASVYFATAQPLQPDGVTALDQSDITSGSSTSAQYLIITPPDFIPTLTSTQLPVPGGTSTFLAYKSGQMNTKVVDVNSIYDQFSNGQINPEAIRTYITAAHASLGTKFVLLVGGDTYDYQNYENCPTATYTDGQGVVHPVCGSNLNNRSFIPSLYADDMQRLTDPSDNLLAVPAGAASDAPQVAIGRMPVYSVAELQTVLTKSMNWSPGSNGYGGTASLATPSRDGDSFRASSEQLIADLAPSFNRAGIGRDYLTGDATIDAGLHTSLITAINSGQELVNWIGHSYQGGWSGMLTTQDVPGLTNVNKPAAVFELGCQTAYYLDPTYRDISSSLLVDANASGPTGAAITVGSTGQDLIDQQSVLSGGSSETGPTGVHYFFGYLSQGKSIGEAMQLAKDDLLVEHPSNSYANPDYLDVVNSYEVFGDPSLTLP